MAKKEAKRKVIKIGSALLAAEDGALRIKWLNSLADDVAKKIKSGYEIIVVSSGAVALGRNKLGIKRKELKLEEKQAAAACGQVELMTAWQETFRRHKVEVAQVLLTISDTEDRRRYLNARNTIETLIGRGIIPIVNENDTVATSEIRYGDNDRLAARVAQMVTADNLILFSDIDGLYTANPRTDKKAKHVAEVKKITDKIRKMADGKGSFTSSGGMITKIEAASMASSAGITTIVTTGIVANPLKKLENGGRKTVFLAEGSPEKARKNWLRTSLKTEGEVIIDDGARKALIKGNSLLPAGVKKIKGVFRRGDAILIKNSSGKEVGRGLAAYSAEEAQKIMGKNTSEIKKILGFVGREELIHRNDMVLAEK